MSDKVMYLMKEIQIEGSKNYVGTQDSNVQMLLIIQKDNCTDTGIQFRSSYKHNKERI